MTDAFDKHHGGQGHQLKTYHKIGLFFPPKLDYYTSIVEQEDRFSS